MNWSQLVIISLVTLILIKGCAVIAAL